MNKDIIALTPEEISNFQKAHSPLTFKNECDLIYESHIPHAGIILIQGELKLIKRKKVLRTLPFGSVIGLHHLINNTPLSMGVKISKNSSVILINKSHILESLSSKSGIIYELITVAS